MSRAFDPNTSRTERGAIVRVVPAGPLPPALTVDRWQLICSMLERGYRTPPTMGELRREHELRRDQLRARKEHTP